jgi:hypothetical protein
MWFPAACANVCYEKLLPVDALKEFFLVYVPRKASDGTTGFFIGSA